MRILKVLKTAINQKKKKGKQGGEIENICKIVDLNLSRNHIKCKWSKFNVKMIIDNSHSKLFMSLIQK